MSVRPDIKIKLTLEDLPNRVREMKKLLKPLSKNTEGPWVEVRQSGRTYIIGAKDEASPSSDYENWFFTTKTPGLKAQYYEVWIRSENRKGEFWYLDKAYLNIHPSASADNKKKEFLCLHCDPAFAPTGNPDDDGYKKQEKQKKYKRMPHIHVGHPMPKAHISLHIGNEANVQSSVAGLFAVMRSAIIMIREEVFDEPERWSPLNVQ
jgi:hypothetical protein